MYNDIMMLNYRILRLLNKMKPMNHREEKRVKQLSAALSLLGIVADASLKLISLLRRMSGNLTSDERERLSFLLELAEIATATIVSSVEPPSIKKAEDAYWKIKNILDLEDHIPEIISDSTPQYAYLLSRIIEIARILEVAENVLLCMALTEKHLTYI